MAAARKDPDVAFKLRQELNIDAFTIARNVVAQSAHGVTRGERRSDAAQGIAGAGCDQAVIRVHNPDFRAQRPACIRAIDVQDARFFDLRSRALGAFEQHSVEIETGVNEQRLIESEGDGSASRGGKDGFADGLARRCVVREKRVLGIRFIRQASAAGLLPGEFLVEEDGVNTSGCEALGREGARGSTAENRDLHGVWPGLT